MGPDYNRLCLKCMSFAVSRGRCQSCGARAGFVQEPPYALPPGSILDGKYLIGTVLGFGGFGITYIGLDLDQGKKVAVKEFMPSGIAGRAPGSLDVTARDEEDFSYGMYRFYDEAKTIYKYRHHANIVHVYKFFKQNRTAYFVMEYLQGNDFRHYLLKRGAPMGFGETMEIILPVMDALECIHQDHVIHRDISPDNIILGNPVKLIDFGAARAAFAGKSRSMSIILKRGFAPEEQYRSRGRQGPWTDVYALAATMYVALGGRMVPEALQRVISDKIVDIRKLAPELPDAAGEAVMKALSVRSDARFQSIGEFRSALMGESGRKGTESPAGVFRIYGIGGYYAGASLTSGEPLYIGRDPGFCQLVYPADSRGISRRHLRLSMDSSKGVVILQDLNSSCGTRVNGMPIPGGIPVALNSGDRFSFGENETFEVDYLAW